MVSTNSNKSKAIFALNWFLFKYFWPKAHMTVPVSVHYLATLGKISGVKVYPRQTWNFRAHAVSACISLWRHSAMHAVHAIEISLMVHACIYLCCMHQPVTSRANHVVAACTYCMGSKVSSLSQIYFTPATLYLGWFVTQIRWFLIEISEACHISATLISGPKRCFHYYRRKYLYLLQLSNFLNLR